MHRLLPPLLACLVLLQLGCFEKDPVNEAVEITLFGDGKARIRTVVDVAQVSDEKEHAAVRERARRVRSDLELGQDEWSRRFGQLSPQEERLTFRRENSQLKQVERSVVVAQSDIARFFADTALSFQFVENFDSAELIVYCGRTRLATAEQRSLLRESLDDVSQRLARYYAAAADLYSYLDAHPDRAKDVFRKLLKPEADADTSENEDVLIERFDKAADAVSSIEIVDEGRDYSLERASRLVYDPFPADLSLIVPGEILELEGFIPVESRRVRVPRIALLPAIATFRDRWLSPDLLTMTLQAGLEGQHVEFDSIADVPRRWSRPSPSDIRSAIESKLASPEQLRVRWRYPTQADMEEMARLREKD